jgi:DNA-binding transcriptional LysR family regulator
MLNIPTDLLRTLVAVVDLRSFTKAAQSLGVTQPAVSAQIKRLQFLLGYDLLDKSAPGVSLTGRGEIVVNHARRLLSINDDILHLTGAKEASRVLRIGIPGDYAGTRLPGILSSFRSRWPDVSFQVRGSRPLDKMLRDLQQGDFDLVIAMTTSQLALEARHVWLEDTAWVCSASTNLDPEAPVPLVSYGEDAVCHRIAVSGLRRAGRDFDVVFTSHSLISLIEAVDAGMGVMVVPRPRAARFKLIAWDDAPLPKMPQLYCSIFLREGGDRTVLEELADHLAAELDHNRPARRQQPEVGGAQIAPLHVTPPGF